MSINSVCDVCEGYGFTNAYDGIEDCSICYGPNVSDSIGDNIDRAIRPTEHTGTRSEEAHNKTRTNKEK